MLYDQALLIQCYADAYIITKDSFFSNIVNDIADYSLRILRHMVLHYFDTRLFSSFLNVYSRYNACSNLQEIFFIT